MSRDPGGATPAARLARGFEIALAVLLAAIMCVTFLDVIGRYLLNAPIDGAYEMIELAMGILVLGAMPLVTARREHIRVDLADALLTGRPGAARDIAVSLASLAISAVITWQLLQKGLQTLREGEATFLLYLPTGPFIIAMAVFLAFNTAVLALLAVRAARDLLRRGG